MDALAALAIVLLSVGVGFAVGFFRDGPSILPNMFSYRAPDWPRGVQEEDDARFNWKRPPEPPRLIVQEVRGRVRPGPGAR